MVIIWSEERLSVTHQSMLSDDLSRFVNEIVTGYEAKESILSNLSSSYNIPMIVFTGTATVGKSSLINALFGGQQVTVVSDIAQDYEPTKQLIWAGTLKLIDSPSYDQSPQEALELLDYADVVVHVYNIDVRRSDRDLEKRIQAHRKHCIIVLNKADLHSKARQIAFVKKAATDWHRSVLCTSVEKREGLGELVEAICKALPEEAQIDSATRIIELGESTRTNRLKREKLKRVREACQQIIEEVSKDAAIIGAEAKPLVDINPLISLYEYMVQKIEREYMAEQMIEDTMLFPFHSGKYILSLMKVQASEKFLPTVGQIVGSINAGNWARCIGLTAIKFYEKQISADQVSKEIHSCLSKFSC